MYRSCGEIHSFVEEINTLCDHSVYIAFVWICALSVCVCVQTYAKTSIRLCWSLDYCFYIFLQTHHVHSSWGRYLAIVCQNNWMCWRCVVVVRSCCYVDLCCTGVLCVLESVCALYCSCSIGIYSVLYTDAPLYLWRCVHCCILLTLCMFLLYSHMYFMYHTKHIPVHSSTSFWSCL